MHVFDHKEEILIKTTDNGIEGPVMLYEAMPNKLTGKSSLIGVNNQH